VRKAGTKIAVFSNKARVLLKWRTRKVLQYLKPKANHAWNLIRHKASQLRQKIGESMTLYPNLWLGGAHAALTIALFSVAYVTRSWEFFHFGVASLATAPSFFINHYAKWGSVEDFISLYRKEIWLASSVITGLLSLGHGWSNYAVWISGLSAICAIITIADWWGNIGKGIGEGADLLWANFKKPFQGEYGVGLTFLLGAFLLFVAYVYLYLGKNNLTDKPLDEARLVVLLMVGLLFSGTVALILKKNQKM
jgi:hypothetical protein